MTDSVFHFHLSIWYLDQGLLGSTWRMTNQTWIGSSVHTKRSVMPERDWVFVSPLVVFRPKKINQEEVRSGFAQ
ncbi:unnamed protein product [Clonostachys rosea]|uniref:Uncharacterized protein n=1 Tax=Bionectria ochroleuca TaxID=29856 RepID=A0ABY6UFE0_BIOOC|nr:unnamed protein product [Clonostachys rosea]